MTTYASWPPQRDAERLSVILPWAVVTVDGGNGRAKIQVRCADENTARTFVRNGWPTAKVLWMPGIVGPVFDWDQPSG
jgi:hypothetical protein